MVTLYWLWLVTFNSAYFFPQPFYDKGACEDAYKQIAPAVADRGHVCIEVESVRP